MKTATASAARNLRIVSSRQAVLPRPRPARVKTLRPTIPTDGPWAQISPKVRRNLEILARAVWRKAGWMVGLMVGEVALLALRVLECGA